MAQTQHHKAPLTGVERTFDRGDFIVSKTDLKGRITYANRLFMKMADMNEKDLIGTPHSVIRHPDMPRCIFKLLWDTIEAKKEIFAYVINRSKNGDHYWVVAHVTPTFDDKGNVSGYHSNRRGPDRNILNNTIIPLYKKLLDIESSVPSRKEGMQLSYNAIIDILRQKGVSYDEFFFSLQGGGNHTSSGRS